MYVKVERSDYMHIFLIRHGESIANNGSNYVKRIPDHLVTLTDTGKKQQEFGLQITAKNRKFVLIMHEYGVVLIAEQDKHLKNLILHLKYLT